jgi:hypothetical protein
MSAGICQERPFFTAPRIIPSLQSLLTRRSVRFQRSAIVRVVSIFFIATSDHPVVDTTIHPMRNNVKLFLTLFRKKVQYCSETLFRFRYKSRFQDRVMKIRRKHCYPPTQFTFAELNKYGVNAVRGPRRVPEPLQKALEAKTKKKVLILNAPQNELN